MERWVLYPTMLVYREGTFYFTPEIVASLAKARPVFLKNPSMPLMYYSKALLVPLSHIPFVCRFRSPITWALFLTHGHFHSLYSHSRPALVPSHL